MELLQSSVIKPTVNKIILALLPICSSDLVSLKPYTQVLDSLRQNISPQNSNDHPYRGWVKNDSIKLSKRDISLNIKSELVFTGKLLQVKEHVLIQISGRYKIIPMLGYIVLIGIFILPLLPIDNPLKLILPLLPYVAMVIKIKIRSKEILNDLQEIIGN